MVKVMLGRTSSLPPNLEPEGIMTAASTSNKSAWYRPGRLGSQAVPYPSAMTDTLYIHRSK